jgi:hypothetical protein
MPTSPQVPTCAVCHTALARADQPCPRCGAVAVRLGHIDPSEPLPAYIVDQPAGEPGGKPSATTPETSPLLRRVIWRAILDPRSIHALLGLGGTLLVIGLVIWLATLGVFKNAAVVAVALGLGNAIVLTAGWWITGRTPYRTAGWSLTLLSCLVMPLNLWFYHSHGLITLSGHLWVAALVCCVLYAASAMILRDAAFVYVLCGGVAMTGLLMLADMGHFWEIAAPSTLLVGLGLICVHVERAFEDSTGPFSRRRFGLAFFWSGHALLAAGLVLLLGAQLAGDWLYPLFQPYYQQWQLVPAAVVTAPWGRLLALGLVVAATYAYAYSDLVVRRVGVYIYLAVFSLLWAEILTINLLALAVTAEAAILVLALTALLSHTFSPAAARWHEHFQPGTESGTPLSPLARLTRRTPPLALCLSLMPVALGVVQYLRANVALADYLGSAVGIVGPAPGLGWMFVAAMSVAAAACYAGMYLYRVRAPWLSVSYLGGAAVATMVGAAGLMTVVGVRTWNTVGPLMMVLPLVCAVASRWGRDALQRRALAWVAQIAAAVVLAAVMSCWLTQGFAAGQPRAYAWADLPLALVFAEVSMLYAVLAGLQKRAAYVYLCAAATSASAWALLDYSQLGAEYYTLAFALVGLALLIGHRIARLRKAALGGPALLCANALVSLSMVAAAMIALGRLGATFEMSLGPVAAGSEIRWSLTMLLASLAGVGLLAAWLVGHAAWRRVYVVLTVAETGLALLTVYVLSTLTLWEKMEVFSILAGTALVVIGHVGWYREADEPSDTVSFNLLLGSLLIGLPLAIAVLINRTAPRFSFGNELGMLTAAIVLLGSGMVLRIRSTTLVGGASLAVYLLTLVLYINMLDKMQTAAIWMTIGGAAVFAAGLLLSVYRDRLLMLPEKMKRHEGIFRVLGWR